MTSESSVRLTMAQAVLRFLQAQYTERDGGVRRAIPAVLGIFGHGNVAGVGQALLEPWNKLEFIQGHNEQSMVHTAAAFARETRRLSTFAVTTSIGPGATNLLTGAALATINRVPVLLLPADAYASRRPDPVLQQLEYGLAGDVSVNDAFRPLSRYFDRIQRPEQLLRALPEAMRVLTDPAETGAVTVALPQDVQAEAWDYPAEFFADRVWEIERPQPDPRLVDRCAELLLNASRPLLVAGGGVWYADASDELEEFSALAGVPVAETFAGKGALNTDSWRQLGALGVEGTRVSNRAANETDLVLCVGTRMADFATGSQSLFKHPDVRFVGINVNAHDAHKQSAMAVRGDAKLTLRALIEATRAAGRKPDPSYQEAIERDRAEWRERIRLNLESGDGLSHGKLITALNAHARAGDVIITAAGAPPGELLKLWDATDDRRCHIEFGYSCMGYELPAGLGARLARPDGRVVVLVGDGSFMINAGEVATLVQEEARVTVVIIDNGGYQIIRRLQEKKTGTTFGNEFRHRSRAWDVETDLETAVAVEDEGQYLGADLTLVAEGLGARALRAGNEEELREALEAADAHDGPTVIVVSVEQQWWLPESGSWWDIAPAEVASDEATMASRREYEQGRSSEPRYYFPFGTRMPAETTS